MHLLVSGAAEVAGGLAWGKEGQDWGRSNEGRRDMQNSTPGVMQYSSQSVIVWSQDQWMQSWANTVIIVTVGRHQNKVRGKQGSRNTYRILRL